MENSIFIARIIGPVYLIIAAGIMLNLKFYQKVMEDYSKNAGLIFLGGLIALLIGFLILLFHNAWAADWAVIITIFGWGGIIKGAWLIIFPNNASKFIQVYQRNKTLLKVHAFAALFIGVCLTIFGYFV